MADMLKTARECPPGPIIEIGVFHGGSLLPLAQIAQDRGMPCFGVDTFTGLPWADPEKGDIHKVGEFAAPGAAVLAAIRAAGLGNTTRLIKGVFPSPAVCENLLGYHFAFAHIDVDQYRSVLESARWLAAYMLPGGIMWFDDVGGWGDGTQYSGLPGAVRAAQEVFGSRLIRNEKARAFVRF